MVSLIETIARSLVQNPEQVEVRLVEEKGDSMVIELKVSESDMGKVIGKQGRIAKAIRSVVKAATAKNSKPVFVEIQRPVTEVLQETESAEDENDADEA